MFTFPKLSVFSKDKKPKKNRRKDDKDTAYITKRKKEGKKEGKKERKKEGRKKEKKERKKCLYDTDLHWSGTGQASASALLTHIAQRSATANPKPLPKDRVTLALGCGKILSSSGCRSVAGDEGECAECGG